MWEERAFPPLGQQVAGVRAGLSTGSHMGAVGGREPRAAVGVPAADGPHSGPRGEILVGEMRGDIFGIPCSLEPPRTRRAIRSVLARIHRRSPEDFERICKRVRGFVPMEKSAPRSQLGAWKLLTTDPKTDYLRDFESPGVIEIREPCYCPTAVVAAELGHACTREADVEKRECPLLPAPFSYMAAEIEPDKWISEMCADHYACRWGFRRDIARRWNRRDWKKYGPPPGQEFLVPVGSGELLRFRVTGRFYIRCLQKEKADGTVIETTEQREKRLEMERRARRDKR